jgi:hypothetical protein
MQVRMISFVILRISQSAEEIDARVRPRRVALKGLGGVE